MFYLQWYENLTEEKKTQADLIIAKVMQFDKYDNGLAIAYSEIERNSPAMAEYRFVHSLRKTLDDFDKDPSIFVTGLEKNGYPIIKDIIKKINQAGVSPQELSTLLKVFNYEGIMDTFYRFEHTYMDDLDDNEFSSFVISEVGTDGELTGRIVDVYGWLSFLNPSNK
ncbi:hypothetical protein [Paenibacillus wynnii]|uniref:hypothetical protein n=1 Tax=Paenibacillus wynnii TaxID=268407 RepID=UPI0027904A98|nr:hypothetical protein [Paenibacillus wynnii]MDQ0194596.1 hypothetical protein [Paenibacillus wynnii]